MSILVTSDIHDGHERILELSHRPFSSVAEMSCVLRSNLWGACEGGDTLYFLGDAACGVGNRKLDVIGELFWPLFTKGVEIHFIVGNHDPSIERLQSLNLFASVSEMKTIKVPGTQRFLTMCHYPLEHWGFESAGHYHVHGHCHGAGVRHQTRRRLDIGVDGHDFKPWSLDEIMAEMRSKPWEAVGHHG